jgi:hypothetical protein
MNQGEGTDHVNFEDAAGAEFNKADFMEWTQNASSNMQSKFFFVQDVSPPNLRNVEVDKTILYEKLNRVDMLLRTEDLNKSGIEKIARILFDKFGIVIDLSNYNDGKMYENSLSTRIYNSLTEDEKEFILKRFDIDNEIYNNDSFFYKLH